MAVQNRPPRIVDLDLEATAELPVIDFGDGHAADEAALPESTAATDVFPAPVVPAGVADLADSLRDVEHRLQRKIERVGKLETDLAAAQSQADALRAQLEESQRAGAERESSLRAELAAAAQRDADLQRESLARQNSLAEARVQLQSQIAALTESQQQAQARAGQQRNQERDLQELRRRSEQQHEALSTWQGFRAVSESRLAESEAQLRDIDARHQAALQEARAHAGRLQDELAAARDESGARIAALTQSLQDAGIAQQATAAELLTTAGRVSQLGADLVASQASIVELQKQIAELRAVEDKARRGAEQFDAQQQQIASLKAELATTLEHLHAAETQLRNAGERVHRLESEAHASAALLGNLQQNIQRLGREDTGSRPALQPPPGEMVLRVLIRHDGGSDIVYPLGRRTSIGRTADNDIQVDTTFVSRHHAVLLSSADHCIVEDLNSTNGVLVNGHRVGRQILHDGDAVTVGKTEFRYQQRS
jgi:chromosome segregation ATPase